MAFILSFKNELSAGLAEVEQALLLNPNSFVFLENIGYLFTRFGDWQRGPALIINKVVNGRLESRQYLYCLINDSDKMGYQIVYS